MSDVANAEPGVDGTLSSAWRTRFEALDRIGADRLDYLAAMQSKEFQALSLRERRMLMFHPWAFVFGVLFYVFKGMWRKAAVLFALGMLWGALLNVVEGTIDARIPVALYWVPLAVVCGQLASFDYYRRRRFGETMWRFVPSWLSHPVSVIGFLLVGIVAGGAAMPMSHDYRRDARVQTLTDISGVWREVGEGTLITIDLGRKPASLTLGERRLETVVKGVDLDTDVVTVEVSGLAPDPVVWSIRQVWQDEGRSTLVVTLHDGQQSALSFVRRL